MSGTARTKKAVRVLLVDDDLIIRKVVCKTLQNSGYEVSMAEDGKKGMVVFEQCAPDIVLLDVEMPVMDGNQMCQALRKTEAGADIPILMLTGARDKKSIDKAYDMGATDYLPKPVAPIS